MVEVFKTNVNELEKSELLARKLQTYFPATKINFDLQDCDKILRVEGENILSLEIIQILNDRGYLCEVLS